METKRAPGPDKRSTYQEIDASGKPVMATDPTTMESIPLVRKLSVAEVDRLRSMGYKLTRVDDGRETAARMEPKTER